MLIAFAIFLFTLVLVIWQPRGLGIGWSASIGALLALALGSVAPGDIPTVWNIVWNATATFIAVIVISLLLDEAGFFEWAALHVARWAGGDGRRLLAVAGRGRVISTRRVLREAPWQIVVFSLGMYLVVYGLKNAGLTDLLAQLLNRLAEHGVWAAALGTGLLSAALSSVMNNMPSVLLGALSIQASDTAGAVREAMIYANVIGCDLGPKITPIGSLATLLWLHVLARKGMRITWGYYFRVGALLTLPVLLATLSALALRLAI